MALTQRVDSFSYMGVLTFPLSFPFLSSPIFHLLALLVLSSYRLRALSGLL